MPDVDDEVDVGVVFDGEVEGEYVPAVVDGLDGEFETYTIKERLAFAKSEMIAIFKNVFPELMLLEKSSISSKSLTFKALSSV